MISKSKTIKPTSRRIANGSVRSLIISDGMSTRVHQNKAGLLSPRFQQIRRALFSDIVYL